MSEATPGAGPGSGGAAAPGGRLDLSRIRHELRTPINHILGYTEMLLEEEILPPGWREVGDLDLEADTGEYPSIEPWPGEEAEPVGLMEPVAHGRREQIDAPGAEGGQQQADALDIEHGIRSRDRLGQDGARLAASGEGRSCIIGTWNALPVGSCRRSSAI